MHIEINYRDGKSSDALDSEIRQSLRASLDRFEDRITRLEVHLGDENAQKEGPRDKRCMIEARPKGLDPIAIEAHGEDYYMTVHDAAGKMSRALETRFGKLDA